MSDVELWFDPICPFAWITSRWMLEVMSVRDVKPTWNIMSLSYLNKDREVDQAHQEAFARAWGPVRVVAAVMQKHDNDAVLRLYTALGSRIHLNKETVSDELITAALAEAGLPADLIEAAHDEAWDAPMIASHSRAIALVGNDVGTPVVAINGVGFFGPVISPAPKGEDAGRLWDGLEKVTSVPGFFELKRSRTVGPIFS